MLIFSPSPPCIFSSVFRHLVLFIYIYTHTPSLVVFSAVFSSFFFFSLYGAYQGFISHAPTLSWQIQLVRHAAGALRRGERESVHTHTHTSPVSGTRLECLCYLYVLNESPGGARQDRMGAIHCTQGTSSISLIGISQRQACPPAADRTSA